MRLKVCQLIITLLSNQTTKEIQLCESWAEIILKKYFFVFIDMFFLQIFLFLWFFYYLLHIGQFWCIFETTKWKVATSISSINLNASFIFLLNAKEKEIYLRKFFFVYSPNQFSCGSVVWILELLENKVPRNDTT